jgi:hypothetical protein
MNKQQELTIKGNSEAVIKSLHTLIETIHSSSNVVDILTNTVRSYSPMVLSLGTVQGEMQGLRDATCQRIV